MHWREDTRCFHECVTQVFTESRYCVGVFTFSLIQVLSLHTGRPGGTKSNLIFTKQKILMIDFLMSALRRHLRSVVISPIGEGKVVVLDISCFGPWRAFSMTDQAGNIWVLSCETENIST